MTRLPGYCTSCKRYRYVESDRKQLAVGAQTGVYQGICVVCEQERLGEDRESGGDRAAGSE